MELNLERLAVDCQEFPTSNYFRGWELIDICFISLGVALIPVTFLLVNPVLCLGIIILWAGLLVHAGEVRLYRSPIRGTQNLQIRVRKKGALWWRDLTSSAQEGEEEGGELLNVEFVKLGDIGLIHNSDTDWDSVIFTGEGSERLCGDFVEHRELADEIAMVGKEVYNYLNRAFFLSFVLMRRPLNMAELKHATGLYTHPGVLEIANLGEIPDEELAEMSRQQQRHYVAACYVNEIFEQLEEISSQTTMAVVLTLPREADLTELLKKPRITPDAIDDLVIAGAISTAQDALERSGVEGLQILDAPGVADYVRRSYDVNYIQTYNDYQHQNRDRIQAEKKPVFFPKPRRGFFAKRQVSDIDGNFGRIYKLTRWPRKVLPMTFFSIFKSETPWLTYAMIGEVSGMGFEVRTSEYKRSAIRAGQAGYYGYEAPPRIQKKNETRYHNEERMVDAEVLHCVNTYVTCLSTSTNGLKHAARAVLKGIRAHFGAAPVKGEYNQLQRFSAGTGIPL